MRGALESLTGASREDLELALPAFATLFGIFAAYFILQPLRDEMGLLLGKSYLPTLFRWSLLVIVLANPVYLFLAGRLPRPRLITVCYRFFSLTTLLFIGALKVLEGRGIIDTAGGVEVIEGWGRGVVIAFYLWVGVYNLFGFAIFWALMADVFASEQGKRVFGFISAGWTLGQFAGSLLTDRLVGVVGPTHLLWFSLLAMEAGLFGMLLISGRSERPSSGGEGPERVSMWAGVTDTLRSPYLLAICLYLLLSTFTASLLYFEKQNMVAAMLTTRAERVGYLSQINMWVSPITFVCQAFLTGRLLPWLGTGLTLALLPLLNAVGFAVLHQSPGLGVLAAFEVSRKATAYALARPAQELLFTVVDRREKYLAKGFIDTFVYRAGDTAASMAVEAMGSTGLMVLPLCLLWTGCGAGLGAAHKRRAEEVLDPNTVRRRRSS